MPLKIKSPQDILNWVARNSAADATGRTGIDAWHQYIQEDVGVTGTVPDLEKLWLRKHGGSGETRRDLWNTYLTAKGFTGNIGDKYRAWLISGTP